MRLSLAAASRRVSELNGAIKILAGLGLAMLSLVSMTAIGPMSLNLGLLALAAIWAAFCLEIPLRLYIKGWAWRHYFGSSIGWLDLAAVLLPAIGLAAGLEARDAALLCGVWIGKFVRETKALSLLRRVLVNEGQNLLSVAWVFLIVLFAAALLAHVLEREKQPEDFGSIPAALWWAVTTLTTTGYGDKVPHTVAGRLLAGTVMASGIGVFALWAGILAAGFAKEVRRHDFLRNWELVARVPLFADLAATDLAEIVQLLTSRSVRPNATICRKGDPGEQMYFIVEGEVTVSTQPPVRLGPGSYFGELALITGEPRTATIVAAGDVSVLVLDISDFRLLLARSPAIAAAINTEAARRLAALKGKPSGAG
jgi:voltage-gated potassium channel